MQADALANKSQEVMNRAPLVRRTVGSESA